MTPEATAELIKQGILGTLLSMSIAANVYLVRFIFKDKDKQIEIAEKYRDTTVVPIEKLTEAQGKTQETLGTILSLISRSVK